MSTVAVNSRKNEGRMCMLPWKVKVWILYVCNCFIFCFQWAIPDSLRKCVVQKVIGFSFFSWSKARLLTFHNVIKTIRTKSVRLRGCDDRFGRDRAVHRCEGFFYVAIFILCKITRFFSMFPEHISLFFTKAILPGLRPLVSGTRLFCRDLPRIEVRGSCALTVIFLSKLW